MGRLIREANTQFNGKESTAKVLVVSDFEHKCFNVNFEVVLQIFEQIQTLLGDDEVEFGEGSPGVDRSHWNADGRRIVPAWLPQVASRP